MVESSPSTNNSTPKVVANRRQSAMATLSSGFNKIVGQDYLSFGSSKDTRDVIPAGEQILFADKIKKINNWGMKQERAIVVTGKGIYNIDGKSIKRKLEYKNLSGITKTTVQQNMTEFTIHLPSEYDYRYQSESPQKRDEIIGHIKKTYAKLFNKNLPIYGAKQQDLKMYTTTEQEAKKNIRKDPESSMRISAENVISEVAATPTMRKANSQFLTSPSNGSMVTPKSHNRRASNLDTIKESKDDASEMLQLRIELEKSQEKIKTQEKKELDQQKEMIKFSQEVTQLTEKVKSLELELDLNAQQHDSEISRREEELRSTFHGEREQLLLTSTEKETKLKEKEDEVARLSTKLNTITQLNTNNMEDLQQKNQDIEEMSKKVELSKFKIQGLEQQIFAKDNELKDKEVQIMIKDQENQEIQEQTKLQLAEYAKKGRIAVAQAADKNQKEQRRISIQVKQLEVNNELIETSNKRISVRNSSLESDILTKTMEMEALKVRIEELEEEVEQLSSQAQEVPTLRKENTDKDIEIEQIKGKNLELQNELELEKKAAEAHGVNQDMIDEQAKKFQEDLDELKLEYETKIQELNGRLQKALIDYQQSERKLNQVQDKLSKEYEGKIKQLVEQVDKLTKELLDTKQSLDVKTFLHNETEEELVRHSTLVKQKTSQHEALVDKNKGLNNRIEELERKAFADVRAARLESESKTGNLTLERDKLIEDNTRLIQELDEFRQSNQELLQKERSQGTKDSLVIIRQKKEIDEMHKQLEVLHEHQLARRDLHQKVASQALESSDNETKQLAAQAEALKLQIKTTNEEKTMLQAENDEHQAKVLETAVAMTALEESHKQLNNQLQELQTNHTEKQEELQTLQDQHDLVKEESDAKVVEATALSAKVIELESQIKEQTIKITEQDEEIKSIREKHAAELAAAAVTGTAAAALDVAHKEELNSLKDQNDELKEAHANLSKQLEFYSPARQAELAKEPLLFSKDSGVNEQKIEDFEVTGIVGIGCYGKVYVCYNKKLGTKKRYAMKYIDKKQICDCRSIQNMHMQKDIFQNIATHPFIVDREFVIQSSKSLYFLTNFVKGGELFHHLLKQTRFSESQTQFMAAQVALALGHLHQNKIVYKDLKAENVLVKDSGYLQLTDFGLARFMKVRKPNTISRVTIEYTAPELLTEDARTDMCVDWWSLGILVYEMMVGVPPFFHKDRYHMQIMIQTTPVLIPNQEQSGIQMSENCKSFIMSLLNKNRKKRLGAKNDVEEVLGHPFLSGINREALVKEQLESPYKPDIGDNFEYFDSRVIEQSGAK